MRRLYQFIKFCFYMTVFVTVCGGVGVYLVFQHFSQDLPKLDSLKDYSPPVISEVFADDGTKVGEFWQERRIVLEEDEIPKLIEDAIVASEDDRFFEHSGIDYLGIIRAMFENLKAGQVVQGGSTITQQVVKSFLLTKERTYERKIKEAILAKRLEDSFDKKQILYLYLNQTYFGNRAYGVEAASQNYFRKKTKDLNIAEVAMIAGLAKAPTKFSPITNFERAKERQEYVIDRMYDVGFITEEQRDRSKKQKLTIYKAPIDKEYNLRYAPWFVEEIRRILIEKYGETAPYTHGFQIHTTLDLKAQKAAEDAIARGLNEIHERHGYFGPIKHISAQEYESFNLENHRNLILATQDPDLTYLLSEKKIKEMTEEFTPGKMYHGLVTAVDGKTKTLSVRLGNTKGTIIAPDFGWARKYNPHASGYNGAMYLQNPVGTWKEGDVVEVKIVDISKAKNPKLYTVGQTYFSLEETPKVEGALFSYEPQTGYVKAIVGGKDYTKSEFNRATQATRQTGSVFKPFLYTSALDKGYSNDTSIENSPLNVPDGPGHFWKPKNYGGKFGGPLSFRSALVASVNVVSARIILDVGTHYVTGMLRKLGISTPIAKVYSMSLGANDMKLMEVARAFGIFPTGGILPDIIFIKKMTDRFGSTIEDNKPKVVKDFKSQIKEGDIRLGKVSFNSDDPESIASQLNSGLWDAAQQWIKTDKLTLTPNEQVILYGKYIPEGYVVTPKTAYNMLKIMIDIVRVGTATVINQLKRPAGGKTGTTNDHTDCWFVGFVPDLVAGVWTGHDSISTPVGAGEAGGKAAAPIFLYYMEKYLEGTPVKNFEIPSDSILNQFEPPVDTSPGSIDGLLGPTQGSGGADFFIDDF